MQLTSHAQMLGACVDLLKCHAPFYVRVVEWKSVVTDRQKGSAAEVDLDRDNDDVTWVMAEMF